MPLEPDHPEQPLKPIGDRTWMGQDIQATRGEWSKLDLAPFKHDAAKGPVTLVVDYAAVADEDARGEALIEVGIECPEADQPCTYPLHTGVVAFRSDYMGEYVAFPGDETTAVQVGRAWHRYTLPDATMVNVWLSLQDRRHLAPRAIRARLVYGEISGAPLPGQNTPLKTFLLVGAIAVMLAGAGFWWLRRW